MKHDPNDINKLLELLDIEDDKLFKIKVLEILGELTLMIHWCRGLFGWLTFTRVVEFDTPEELQNYRNMMASIELYEKFSWESVPSRTMLLQLINFRRGEPLDPEVEKLLIQDEHGRIPFGPGDDEMNDIQEVLKRLREARSAYAQMTDNEDVNRSYGHAASLLGNI